MPPASDNADTKAGAAAKPEKPWLNTTLPSPLVQSATDPQQQSLSISAPSLGSVKTDTQHDRGIDSSSPNLMPGSIRAMTLKPDVQTSGGTQNPRQALKNVAPDHRDTYDSEYGGSSGGGFGETSGSGSSGSGSGSSGSNLLDKPPIISGGGAGIYSATFNGTGSLPIAVPVGAKMSLTAVSPDPLYVINTTHITWGGGTNYVFYMDEAQGPGHAPPNQMAPVKGVNLHNQIYDFVVDATPRTYTVTLTVDYINGTHGSSTMSFTSQKPTYSFTNESPGVVAWEYDRDPNNPDPKLSITGISFGMLYPRGTTDRRIKFTADTRNEPQAQLLGTFMIMQLINGETIFYHNNGNGTATALTQTTDGKFVIDDGWGEPKAIGQPLLSEAYGWASEQTGGILETSHDYPHVQSAETFAQGFERR